MTTVYIIRHAEAEGNLYRRVHGWYDSHLTDQGLRQVEALKKRFENVRIDAVYASDKQRTQMTARAVLDGRDMALRVDPRLREFGMGTWEDEPWGEVQRIDRENYMYFNSDPAKYVAEGAEKHEDVQNRMMSALSDAAAENDGGTVAMFSHGAAIRALLARIFNIPSENITEIAHGDNTAVTKLVFDGDGIEVEYMGDCSHLNGLTRTLRQTWMKSGGIDTSAMRFEPVEFPKDGESYLACRAECGFGAECIDAAMSRAEKDKRLVMWALHGERRAGLPDYRGRLLAVQLLGHAVSYYRGAGYKRLRVTLPHSCGKHAGFFEHFGFVKAAETADGTVLDKEI